MPNILLTTACNLSCPFCFAQEKLSKGSRVMSLANVRTVLTFLKQSDFMLFRAMGGEPTLHPQFDNIVIMALQEGMRIDILSNATWRDDLNDLFARITPARLSFLLNVDNPIRYSSEMWERVERNLDRLKGRVGTSLSFNIFEAEPQYQYVLDLARKYRIWRIRLCFSLPVFDTDNRHWPLDRYREKAEWIVSFVRLCESYGIEVQLDNAIPLCMFDYQQLGELVVKGVLDLKRNVRCEPVLDIGPELDVWYCFCLSKLYNRRLEEFANLNALQNYFQKIIRRYQDELFPWDQCTTCEMRNRWQCQGGCLTFSVVKHMKDHDRDDTGAQPQPRYKHLRLAPGVELHEYDLPIQTFWLRKSEVGTEVEIGNPLISALKLMQQGLSVPQIVSAVARQCSAPCENGPLDALEREVVEDSILGLLEGLTRRGFLEADVVHEKELFPTEIAD